MWLAWDIAAAITALCVITWVITRQIESRSFRLARPFARELSVMFGLYTVWQIAGRISVIDQAGAFRRGRQLWDLQRFLHLPNEAVIQEWLLPHGWLIQASNIYYAVVHVPAVIICLLWLFLRSRPHYHLVRTDLALFTGAALLIQLVAVAPPRFIDGIGIVDTGIVYNQSVYSSLGYEVAGQLQAMPSIHVGWAFLVGIATWRVGTGWVRWSGVAHAAITFVVVAVTGNHYWLDGIIAGIVLVAAMHIQRLVRRRALLQAAALMMDDTPTSEADDTPESDDRQAAHPR